MLEVTDTVFNCLSFSSILILAALGLAITFGVMRVINMAHGEMLMLGGYTAHVVSSSLPRWLQRQGMEGFGTHLSEYGLYFTNDGSTYGAVEGLTKSLITNSKVTQMAATKTMNAWP